MNIELVKSLLEKLSDEAEKAAAIALGNGNKAGMLEHDRVQHVADATLAALRGETLDLELLAESYNPPTK